LLNGMPVVISHERTLLDGLQRLAACAVTGIPLCTLLAEGAGEAIFPTINQHQRRTFSAALKPLGFGHHQLLGNLMFQMARYDEGTVAEASTPLMPWVKMLRILAQRPALRHATSIAVAKPDSLLPVSVRSAIVYMGYHVNQALTNQLLNAAQHPD